MKSEKAIMFEQLYSKLRASELPDIRANAILPAARYLNYSSKFLTNFVIESM